MESAADRHPVLLVHGIWKTGAAFGRMARYLRAQGLDVHTLDLQPNDGSAAIEQLAAQIAAVAGERFPEGAPFDLVGFSMGGVVSRYYLQRLGGVERVRRFVTISSPHHGTATAYLSKKPGALQMRPGSPFLAELNRDVAMLARLDVTSMWTPLDLMILPAESSRLPVGREVQRRRPALHALMPPRSAGAPACGRGAGGPALGVAGVSALTAVAGHVPLGTGPTGHAGQVASTLGGGGGETSGIGEGPASRRGIHATIWQVKVARGSLVLTARDVTCRSAPARSTIPARDRSGRTQSRRHGPSPASDRRCLAG